MYLLFFIISISSTYPCQVSQDNLAVAANFSDFHSVLQPINDIQEVLVGDSGLLTNQPDGEAAQLQHQPLPLKAFSRELRLLKALEVIETLFSGLLL